MEKKSTVSDAAKAAAAKKAAEAKKAADAKKAGTKSSGAKKPASRKATPTKAVKQQAEEAVERAPESSGSNGKSSVKGLRIGAIILWVLAIGAEVAAFFAFSFAIRNSAQNWTDPEFLLMIGALVADAIFCIVAAQLWKIQPHQTLPLEQQVRPHALASARRDHGAGLLPAHRHLPARQER